MRCAAAEIFTRAGARLRIACAQRLAVGPHALDQRQQLGTFLSNQGLAEELSEETDVGA